MNKEEVYDAEINPLMHQIMDICRSNGIAMIASFAIETEEQPDLACTSHLPDARGDFPFKKALNIIKPPARKIMNLKVVRDDGSVELITIV